MTMSTEGIVKKQYLDSEDNACVQPIFIIGICQRCGTNYLRNLLTLHKDCYFSGPITEDKILRHAHLLNSYAEKTYNLWGDKIKNSHVSADLLRECLGNGLIQFLNRQSLSFPGPADDSYRKIGTSALRNPRCMRLVTKTPSVKDLPHFFTFFPRSQLLIIIRDGRSVVESAVRSFKWSYETAMRIWAQGAASIVKFIEESQDKQYNYLIIRYEDLFIKTEEELKRIFKFLKLNEVKYDFKSALNLKVSGSSDLLRQGHKDVHWHWIDKTAEFQPVKRWGKWDRKLHERFNWINGKYLDQFGYRTETYKGKQRFWKYWNLQLDMKWKARAVISRLKKIFIEFLL